jgi:hypothetical protein
MPARLRRRGAEMARQSGSFPEGAGARAFSSVPGSSRVEEWPEAGDQLSDPAESPEILLRVLNLTDAHHPMRF